jgi:uncharacterized protein YggU (UPF0235/DUF167 family)
MKINVAGHPKSKRPRIETDLLGSLHVYVAAPPLEGKANKAIIEMLAKHFKVQKSKIIQLTGFKSKNKTFKLLN